MKQPALALVLAIPLIPTLAMIGYADGPNWQLVWSDEFDAAGRPDEAKWALDTGGHGFGNQELQYYTGRPENVRIRDGKLIIEARKEEHAGNEYTSAKLVTKGKASWKYGRIVVRARLPQGRGTWPAIWMLPDTPSLQWPDDGEIDVMEHVGHDPGVVHASIHSRAYNHLQGTQKTSKTKLSDNGEGFHVFAVEWSEDQIDFFVDRRRYHRVVNERLGPDKWPFDKGFYLILNMAIGGTWGGSVDEACLPQRMEVDYVRVYQRSRSDLRRQKVDINSQSPFEAACVADFDCDGKLDFFCSDSWYQAPDWQRHKVREVPASSPNPHCHEGFANLPNGK